MGWRRRPLWIVAGTCGGDNQCWNRGEYRIVFCGGRSGAIGVPLVSSMWALVCKETMLLRRVLFSETRRRMSFDEMFPVLKSTTLNPHPRPILSTVRGLRKKLTI